VKYYSIPSTGICAPVDDETPSWINEFYTDWKECCKVGWQFEKCMEEAPPNAIQIETTSTTTTEAPQTSYYEVPSTGLCVVVDDKIPSWIGKDDIFTSYVECCKQSWNPDPCLLAAPPGLPTSQPSPSPSIAIIPQPTDAPDPTSNPTIHPTTERPISSKPTTSPVEIAEYESSCKEAGPWHPTEDFSMCTNTFDYDKSGITQC
jgi:hypothetical protein